MNTRTIMIFPEFENVNVINDIRKKYDPLTDLALPHMTVGKLSSMELLDKAFDSVNKCKDKFSTVVKNISVEMIGEHEESIIVIEHELNWQVPIWD